MVLVPDWNSVIGSVVISHALLDGEVNEVGGDRYTFRNGLINLDVNNVLDCSLDAECLRIFDNAFILNLRVPKDVFNVEQEHL